MKRTVADKEFLEWANKGKFFFAHDYGDAAMEAAKRYVQFYKQKEGILKKYLL